MKFRNTFLLLLACGVVFPSVVWAVPYYYFEKSTGAVSEKFDNPLFGKNDCNNSLDDLPEDYATACLDFGRYTRQRFYALNSGGGLTGGTDGFGTLEECQSASSAGGTAVACLYYAENGDVTRVSYESGDSNEPGNSGGSVWIRDESSSGGPTSTSVGALDYRALEAIPGSDRTGQISPYLQAVYRFALWAVGIAALFMLSVGGMMYLTSAGNTSAISTAKKVIFDALIGLVLAMLAWLVLYVLNPQLVHMNLDIFSLGAISTRGAAAASDGTTSASVMGTDCSTTGTCQCSASSLLPEAAATRTCIRQAASARNIVLGQETTTGGTHTCNRAVSPPRISCHFGGRLCNGYGNAIDYGGHGGAVGTGSAAETHAANYQAIVNIAEGCGVHGAYCETGTGARVACTDAAVDHIHITVLGSCGCN